MQLHQRSACELGMWQDQGVAPRIRPIATPCRSYRLPTAIPLPSAPLSALWDSAEIPADLETSHTLLEEAACDPHCQAFYLASTLLETLCEHFAEIGVVTSATGGRPKPVQLCSLLPYGAAPPGDATCKDPSWPKAVPANSFTLPPAVAFAETRTPFHFAGMSLRFTLEDARCLVQAGVPVRSISEVRGRCSLPGHWNENFFQSQLQDLRTACTQGELLCYTDGSFTPASSARAALCGWACVFIDPHAYHLSALFGAVDFKVCPSDSPSAYLGECSGLLAAALASIAAYQWRPVHFLSDCTSALAAASGTAAYTLGGLAQTCRNAFCLRRAVGHAHDTFAYVPGHSGCFGNDLADALSKLGARSPSCCGVQLDEHNAELWLGQGGRLLPWLGVTLRCFAGDTSLPPVNSYCLGHDRWHGGASPGELLAPFLPPGVMQTNAEAPQTPDQATFLRLCVATFNTLSLSASEDPSQGEVQGTGLAFLPGRTQILADQLHSHDVQAVCLQETRCEQGSLRTHGFLRFCSGAVRGQWGTEWWFREDYGFIVDTQAKQPVARFRANLFTKLFADPRRLFLRYVCGSFRVVFIGLHAPHRATERDALQAWWEETHSLIRTHARNDAVVLAGDMNASLGSVHSKAVGACGAETEDVPGEALHAILLEFEIITPSTWEHVHQGPHHTYVQKRGHRLCRPDFVGVPLPWVDHSSVSVLAPAINAGHSCPDHVAATFVTSAACSVTRPGRRIQGRRFKACELTGECAARVAQAISQFQEPSWDVSSHAHAAALVGHVQQALGDAIPKRQSKRYRSYLTDDTWTLQRRVASVRRSLHRLQHHTRLHSLAIYFGTWRNSSTFSAECAESWTRRARVALATHLTSLHTLGTQLKKACRRDRDAYLAQLADQLAQSPAPEVFRNLHALLGHRRRKKYQIDPLPAVAELDGQMCRDTEGTLRRWREHFGGMEGGKETSIPDLIDRWNVRILAGVEDCPWPAPPDVANIPTESDLHRLLVLAKAGKSPGMDGIPVEVGRQFAGALAPHLHRIALKIAFRGSEPCGFKAGQAIWFYKGKGPHTTCSSFRAILLLPVWAKIVHQALRPPMKAHFEQHAPSLQLGGKSQCTAVFGCHLVRSACRVAIAAGHSHFTLFADIASAYYCVIQQLVAAWAGRGANSSLVAGDLSLPPAACAEIIQEHIQQPTALRAGGASTWLEALTESFQSDNFFLLRGDDTAVLTSRGSRPGSSWADLIFAALIRRILERRNQLRASHPGVSSPLSVPFDGKRCLDPCPGDAPPISISEVVWADDLAVPRITNPTHAAHAIGFESGILTDAFFEFGFSLSFGPHKTAGLLSLRGQGSRRASRAVFSSCGLNGQIPVLLEDQPGVCLPLVASYRHLGCQQAPAGGLRLEIQYRVSQARATFSEGRRKVYKNPKISVRRKGHILGSTVLPKLVYGAGAWGPLSAGETRLFSGALWGFYRPLLGIGRGDDQRLDASTCFALLGLPSPATLLRTQRLLYLGQLIRAGPDELWAVLRADRPHAELLRADTRWLHDWVYRTTGLPHPDSEWDAWVSFVKKTYGKFKGAVKRARTLDIHRHTVIAALSGLHRALTLVCGSAETEASSPPPSTLLEVCIPCRRAFADRLSWSGHAARKHGYRSHAFLCAKGSLCLACGRQFSAPGRLRRHLYAKSQCVREWGTFTPSEPNLMPTALHPQAPPGPLPGSVNNAAALGIRTDVALGLLGDLETCNPEDESEAWNLVTSYVEPIEILRQTVREWASLNPCEAARAATAENLLLLLDVELLADHVQPKSSARAFPQDTLPTWGMPGPAPFVLSGEAHTLPLLPPPPVRLDLAGPTSVRLRDALAYSTWMEDGCAVIARALEASRHSPVGIPCPGIDVALGPASSWLRAAGFIVKTDGIFSPRD